MPPEYWPTRRSAAPVRPTRCEELARTRSARLRLRDARGAPPAAGAARARSSAGRWRRPAAPRRWLRRTSPAWRTTSKPATRAVPAVGREQRREHPDSGRLAGAVGPRKPKISPCSHGEVDAGDGDDVAVATDQALGLDGRRVHGTEARLLLVGLGLVRARQGARTARPSGGPAPAAAPGAPSRPPRPGARGCTARGPAARSPRACSSALDALLERLVLLAQHVEPLLGVADVGPLVEEGPGGEHAERQHADDARAAADEADGAPDAPPAAWRPRPVRRPSRQRPGTRRSRRARPRCAGAGCTWPPGRSGPARRS